jgi:hypothetical protein
MTILKASVLICYTVPPVLQFNSSIFLSFPSRFGFLLFLKTHFLIKISLVSWFHLLQMWHPSSSFQFLRGSSVFPYWFLPQYCSFARRYHYCYQRCFYLAPLRLWSPTFASFVHPLKFVDYTIDLNNQWLILFSNIPSEDCLQQLKCYH